MAKNLFRSQRNRVIAGVCGGLGIYFNIDPVIFRIIFLCSIFLGGLGVLIYLLIWLLAPYNPDGE